MLVKDRIQAAMALAAAVQQAQWCAADQHAVDCALEGIANGTAVEIISTLGWQPKFVNLRRTPL